MKWSVGITTAPRHGGTSYLADTVKSLEQAGWPDVTIFGDYGSKPFKGIPTHIVQDRRVGSWPNFQRALRWMREHVRADAYMVCQDDILLARHCREWLEPELWPFPKIGCMDLYVSAVTSQDMTAGWYASQDEPYGTGALAVVMPRESVDALLDNPTGKGSMSKTDYFLEKFCCDTQRPFVRHNPSLVRHIGKVSTFENRGGDRPITRDWIPARHEGEWVADARAWEVEKPPSR